MSYSKITSDGKDLVYRFAPPQTDLDRTGKKKPIDERGYGPKFPEELSQFTSSVYYYWWAFLRLSPEYIKCCEQEGRYDDDDPKHLHLRELYKDFGDVRDNAGSTDESFRRWWIARGWLLFVEPNEVPDAKIQNRPFSDIHDRGDRIYISMQRDMEPKALLKQLNEYLNQLPNEQQVAIGNKSRALYQPRHHKLTALAKYLAIKQAQLKHLNEHGELPTHERLMDLAGIDFSGKDDVFLRPNGKSYKASGKRKAGSELVNAADNIIKYIVYGRFPITVPDHEFDVLDEIGKLRDLPKTSSYLRFSSSWLGQIKRSEKDFSDLVPVRQDIRPSLHEIAAHRRLNDVS